MEDINLRPRVLIAHSSIRRKTNTEYKVGIHWAAAQVLDLLDNGVKGIHFYTLNRSKAALNIYEWLGVSSSQGLGQRRATMHE